MQYLPRKMNSIRLRIGLEIHSFQGIGILKGNQCKLYSLQENTGLNYNLLEKLWLLGTSYLLDTECKWFHSQESSNQSRKALDLKKFKPSCTFRAGS